MQMLEEKLNSLEDTKKFAERFAKTLHAPVVVALHGDLGAGKTEISRAIIRTLMKSDVVVPSPTFTIVQSYDTPVGRISHFDLYRIENENELEEIGLIEACANDITLIEWPDIANKVLPKNSLHLYISQKDNVRYVKLESMN